MYLAKGGDYAKAPDPLALLAEHIETIGWQENTKWASLQQPQKNRQDWRVSVTANYNIDHVA